MHLDCLRIVFQLELLVRRVALGNGEEDVVRCFSELQALLMQPEDSYNLWKSRSHMSDRAKSPLTVITRPLGPGIFILRYG